MCVCVSVCVCVCVVGYFLKDVGVMLNQAFINYGIAFLRAREYTVLQPPYFMNKDVMAGVAQLEQFDEELYKVSYSFVISFPPTPLSLLLSFFVLSIIISHMHTYLYIYFFFFFFFFFFTPC